MKLPPYITEKQQQEITDILKYTMKKYGRYQFMVLKNLLTATIYGSMLKTYIPFNTGFQYIKELICMKDEKPEDIYSMKHCVIDLRENSYCWDYVLYGIQMTTILYKTPYHVFCEITNQQNVKLKEEFQTPQYISYFKHCHSII